MSDNSNDNDNNGEDKSKLKIVFAEGCFDNFVGTQEELDELMASLQSMVEDGTFFENATAVSMEDMMADILSGDVPEEVLGQILAEALKESGEDFDIDPEVMDLSRMIPPGNTRH
jgi:hypothetical protein